MAETTRDRAVREAGYLFVAFSEDPEDPVVRERIARWLRSDSENTRAWNEIADIDGLVTEAFTRQPVTSKANRIGLRGRQGWVVAAAGALAACLTVVMMTGMPLRLQADVVTETGESRHLVLADGSAVDLAPGSAIAIDLDGQARRVSLLQGEAYFDVATDPLRPFSVVLDTHVVTALGTAFNLRRDGDGSALLSVREGRVRLSRESGVYAQQSELAILVEGDRIRFGPNGAGTPARVRPEDIAPWRDGRLVARDETISSVVEILERYWPGRILIANDALSDARVSGIYSLAEPVAALKAAAGAHDARVIELGFGLAVVSAR